MDEPSRWNRPCPTEDELWSLADRPTLRRYEVLQLIQGFLPTSCLLTYLDSRAKEARTLLQAFTDGVLADPVRPEKFVQWCITKGIPLPEQFVARVLSKIMHLRRPISPTEFTDERVWKFTGRGRPKKKASTVVRGLEAEICNIAHTLVIDFIKRYGYLPPKKLVTQKLSVATGRKARDIDRCYCVKTCITDTEFVAAKRRYRSARYGDSNRFAIIPRIQFCILLNK